LRRIVRQAATELGKEVDFDLDNVEGEMDRTVLERMVAPLEHMLRNAVDHGIEMPTDRTASGKSVNGRILLSLAREGSEVVLRLKDDGRGINLQRIREKAIERGLMAADAKLSDDEVIQFILHAGFSTAEKVTQISGRGVGMDVVASEIKQLGGNMIISSAWGRGTEFEIRLPFTVSVNRALMIQIGEDLYAVPLNTIEGIVRVSPFELEHYYQDPTASFDYAGENYLVRYLGGLLDSDTKPKLDGQGLPLPVILVRSADQTVALQVDRLLGSREIVVKTLGMQFGSVRGVSGATIMGDGSVVVILDLHAVIREQRALNLQLVPMDLPSLSAPTVEEDTSEKNRYGGGRLGYRTQGNQPLPGAGRFPCHHRQRRC
jgi:chemosensory pili system protein ChpA (sensor histidine kinase/response regulator)